MQALGDLRHRHATLHVLFIGEDQQASLLQVLGKKGVESVCLSSQLETDFKVDTTVTSHK